MNETYGTMYYVDDMNQSLNFFKNQLGLKVTHESKDWSEFSIDGHNLCLHAKTPGQQHPQNGILIFKTDGINALFNRMKEQGLNVFGLHQVHPGASTFHLKDKNNNEFSFYGQP